MPGIIYSPRKKKYFAFLWSSAAQQNLFIIIAFLILIFFIIFYFSTKGNIEKSIETTEIKNIELKKKIQRYTTSIENIIEISVSEAVVEMGKHGGYTRENLPIPYINGIPIYLQYGSITNLPSKELMETMLAKEIQKRIDSHSMDLFSFYTGKIYYFVPSQVNVRLENYSIVVDVKVMIRVTDDDSSAKTTLSFHKVFPYRLLYLRTMAERYIKDEMKKRAIEHYLLNAMVFNPDIPNPFGQPPDMRSTISCKKLTVFKTKQDIIISMHKTILYSITKEKNRIRENPYLEGEYLEWGFSYRKNSLNLSFIANKGAGYPYESEDIVYYVPDFSSPVADQENNICGRKYNVSYTISFPVRITITDIDISSSIKSLPSTNRLEFSFYIIPFLKDNNQTKTIKSTLPERINSLCDGSCNAIFHIENSKKGILYLDSCRYEYSHSTLELKNIPCGIHTLSAISLEPLHYSKYIEKINIGRYYVKKIGFKSFINLHGRVFLKNKIYCKKSKRIIEKDPILLRYVDGNPPRAIIISLYPVRKGFANVSSIFVNKMGEFSFKNIIPGKYIIIALPSKSRGAIPTYKARPYGDIIDLRKYEGQTVEYDIMMTPLKTQKIGEIYHYINTIEDC